MPRPRGRPKDTPAKRRARLALREQRLRHRQALGDYLRRVAREEQRLRELYGTPRRSLRIQWTQDNRDLIAEGHGPEYTFVLFGEPEFDLINPPLEGVFVTFPNECDTIQG